MDTNQERDEPQAEPSSSQPKTSIFTGFDAYCPQLVRAKERVTALLRHESYGVILAGRPGTGKTHLAKIVAHRLAQRASYQTEDGLLDAIRATFTPGGGSAEDILGRIRRAEYVIIEDVGVGYVRDESLEWLQGIYWKILDQRFEKGLPVMLTSNLKLGDLMVRIGPRAASRLTALLLHNTKRTEQITDNANYVDLFAVRDHRQTGGL